MDSLFKLFQEMKEKELSQSDLDAVLASLTVPVGSPVSILHTCYSGTVVAYNTRRWGFYPAARYPYMVRIDHVSDLKFSQAKGKVFEYSADQVIPIQ